MMSSDVGSTKTVSGVSVYGLLMAHELDLELLLERIGLLSRTVKRLLVRYDAKSLDENFARLAEGARALHTTYFEFTAQNGGNPATFWLSERQTGRWRPWTCALSARSHF